MFPTESSPHGYVLSAAWELQAWAAQNGLELDADARALRHEQQ